MSYLSSVSLEFSPRKGIFILLVLHIVGLVGIVLSPYSALFIASTPLHLLICGGILFWFEEDRSWKFFAFLLLLGLLGFGAETVGVHGQWLFGSYSYGQVFGPRIAGVPPLIGLLWATLIYALLSILSLMPLGYLQRALVVALALVGLDALLEPAAIKLGFWAWDGGVVNPQNYRGWVLCGFLFSLLGQKIFCPSHNPIAVPLLAMQTIFFVCISLFG